MNKIEFFSKDVISGKWVKVTFIGYLTIGCDGALVLSDTEDSTLYKDRCLVQASGFWACVTVTKVNQESQVREINIVGNGNVVAG